MFIYIFESGLTLALLYTTCWSVWANLKFYEYSKLIGKDARVCTNHKADEFGEFWIFELLLLVLFTLSVVAFLAVSYFVGHETFYPDIT